MPPEEKLEVLRELSNQDWIATQSADAQFRYGEAKVRQLCAERGRQDWDVMDEDERLQFIDDAYPRRYPNASGSRLRHKRANLGDRSGAESLTIASG